MDDTQANTKVARHLAVAALAAAAAICTPPAGAAVDIFLKLGDIKGESQDDKHKDEIDVLAWSWGVNQSGVTGDENGAAARRGRRCLSGLTVKKRLDKATPLLVSGAVTNTTVPTATLTFRKAGEGQQEFFKVVLSEVTISAFVGGGANSDTAQTESVLLGFSSATLTFTAQSSSGAPVAVTKTVPGGC